MSSPKEIAQSLMLIVLAVVVVTVLLFLLTGCLGLEGKQEQRQQSLTIAADCEENTIDVMIDDDQDDQAKEINVTK